MSVNILRVTGVLENLPHHSVSLLRKPECFYFATISDSLDINILDCQSTCWSPKHYLSLCNVFSSLSFLLGNRPEVPPPWFLCATLKKSFLSSFFILPTASMCYFHCSSLPPMSLELTVETLIQSQLGATHLPHARVIKHTHTLNNRGTFEQLVYVRFWARYSFMHYL